MKHEYENYFKNHYKSNFTNDDIIRYRNWFATQWNFLNSRIHGLGKGNILEIGSGIGGLYSFLNKIDCHYTGLELDKSAVEFSSSYFKENLFKNVSLELFDCDRKFNQIFAFEVLEHFHNPIASIQKISTLLDKDGIFIGSSPYPYRKNIIADKTHHFVLHPENWKRLFLNAGFSKVNIYPLSLMPYLWRLNKKLNIRLPFYISLPTFISTSIIVAEL